MRKEKILPILFIILTISLLLTGCAEMSQVVLAKGDIDGSEKTADQKRDILYSDITAIDYLEGVWTTNKGDYLAPQRGDSELIVWSTNMPIPSCNLYVLREGVLYGGVEDGREIALLSFTIVDEERMNVTDMTSEREYAFLREGESVDTSRLDNEYVFHSMSHAVPYLSGMWMNGEGNHFSMIINKDGDLSWNSDLPCPQVDAIDFYDGKLCGVSQQELVVLFSFDIQGADTVMVTCHTDGSETLFTRLSRTMEEALRNADYVFSNNQLAFTFLDGSWGELKDVYFNVTNEGGSLSWKTNLPLDDSYQGYEFSGGGLQGIHMDETGTPQRTMIYSFEIHSEDEITITVCETGESYRLKRSETELREQAEDYTFLDGFWENEEGIYFTVANEDGSRSLKTNLPLDDTFQGYGFANGGLIGTRVDENGEEQTEMIYTFELHSETELTITVCETEESYLLKRTDTETEAQEEAETQNDAS